MGWSRGVIGAAVHQDSIVGELPPSLPVERDQLERWSCSIRDDRLPLGFHLLNQRSRSGWSVMNCRWEGSGALLSRSHCQVDPTPTDERFGEVCNGTRRDLVARHGGLSTSNR